MMNVSNSNLIRNADEFLAKMDTDPEVKWIGKNKMRVDASNLKLLFQFLNSRQYFLLEEIWDLVLFYVQCFIVYLHQDKCCLKYETFVSSIIEVDS